MHDPGLEDFIISISLKTDIQKKLTNIVIIIKYKLFCIKIYVSKTRKEHTYT